MARRSVRTIHTTGAFLGATAMALVGSPAADTAEPHLSLVPSHVEPRESTASAFGVGAGGPAMGKSSLPAGLLSPSLSKSSQTYTVKSGDTVWALAKAHNTTTAKIIEANNLGSNALIRVGQKLTIPGAKSASSGGSTSSRPAASKAPRTHTVAAGQTLSSIAAQYGTTTSKLASINNISNPNFIRVGQKLNISGSASSTGSKASSSKPATSSGATTTASYTVRSGDTLWGIARAHNTSVSALISANGLSSDGFIRVGQRLNLSASGANSSANSGTAQSAPPANACKDLVPSTFLHYTYSDDVVRAANENKCTLNSISVPGRDSMQRLVRQTALNMGVNPALAQAVAFQESGFNQRAVSPANAIGTMQVIPSSGQWAGQLLGRQINLLDPNDNVAAGVAILRSLQRSFPTNLDYAIGAYYQGAGSVSKYGLASDTRNYVNAVKSHMSRYN